MTAGGALPELTNQAAGPTTYTASEAARAVHLAKSRVTELCRLGLVDAIQVDGRWLIDGASLAAWRSTPHVIRRRPIQRLDSRPLVRQVELAGGRRACGVIEGSAEDKALDRAIVEGSLTVWAADNLAVGLLGLTLWDLWGAQHDI